MRLYLPMKFLDSNNYNNNFISSKIVSSIPLNRKRYSFLFIPIIVGKDISPFKEFLQNRSKGVLVKIRSWHF